MATAVEIEEVRGYVSEPNETDDWSDVIVGGYIDRATSATPLLEAAADIWAAKAGKYVALVNVSESGSSRQLGSLMDNALKMASYYRGRVVAVAASPPATPSGPIISDLARS